jgi:chromosome segregation ATPase
MKIISLLSEAEVGNKASLPIDRDLLYKARQKYPQYSGEQALTLYIADEMKEKDKTDSNQNRLIDTQQRENERLRGVVDNLGQTVEQEIQQVAQQAEINDREISRIKQLTGTLSKGGTDTQRKAKLSSDDLEKLQKELEQLKNKPGMDPEKFNQLKKQIETMVSNPSIDNKELVKINSLVNTLTQQRQIGDDLYKKVEDQLIKTKKDLDDKEGRFSKYIEKKKGEIGTIQQQNAGEIKKYSDIVKSYQQDIEKFNSQVEKLNKDREFINNEKQIIVNLRGEVQQNAEIIQQKADSINNDSKSINNDSKELGSTFLRVLTLANLKSSLCGSDQNSTPPSLHAASVVCLEIFKSGRT